MIRTRQLLFHGKSLPTPPKVGESYFAICERDKGGHCLPSGESEAPKPVKRAAEKGKLVSAKRIGKGKKAKVVLSNGEVAPDHIKPAMVPPAWKNVKISLDPNADVQVTAVDSDGNKKKVYHDDYNKNNQAANFAKILEGLQKMDSMYDQNQENRKDQSKKEDADCMWLMMEQATRVGGEESSKAKKLRPLYDLPVSKDNIEVNINKKKQSSVKLKFGDTVIPIRDEGTKEQILERMEGGNLENSTFWLKSYGAATLEGRHIVQAPDGTRLQFVGKEGVWHDHLIKNPKLAEMLLERKKVAGEDKKIFKTTDGKVSKYSKSLDGGDFTPKNFRTLKATKLALDEINKRGDCCKDPEEYKNQVMEVGTIVSRVLGNRPQQAIESYIAPTVWTQWQNAG